jgi:hypothetical protein
VEGEKPVDRLPAESIGPLARAATDERIRKIDRAQTGLKLLIVAALLLWIPYVEVLGLLIGAIAVIMVILAADAFGWRHEMFVWTSVFLFVAAHIAEFALVGSFAASVGSLPSSAPGPVASIQIQAAFDDLLRGSIAVVSVAAISLALISFEVNDLVGRVLAIGAVVIQISISVVLFFVVFGPLIHQAIADAFASGTYDPAPIVSADTAVRGLASYSLLNSIPAILFAVAYYRAYTRVGRFFKPTQIVPLPAPRVVSPPLQ